jgi:hypothetical protein
VGFDLEDLVIAPHGHYLIVGFGSSATRSLHLRPST